VSNEKCKAHRETRTEKVTYGVRVGPVFESAQLESARLAACAHAKRITILADILVRANHAEKVSILRTWAEKESLSAVKGKREVMRIREIRLLRLLSVQHSLDPVCEPAGWDFCAFKNNDACIMRA
jgi:hypothetical protein